MKGSKTSIDTWERKRKDALEMIKIIDYQLALIKDEVINEQVFGKKINSQINKAELEKSNLNCTIGLPFNADKYYQEIIRSSELMNTQYVTDRMEYYGEYL